MATGSRTRNRVAHAQRSLATRRKILTAATDCFIQQGYLQTTMADIARTAGVAVQTLYLSYGGKASVLAAALDVAIVGDDEPVPVLDRPWHARFLAAPDARSALAVFVATASETIHRHYPLYAAIRSSAADPEVAELLQRNRSQRYATHSTVVRELAARPDFPRRDVTAAAQAVYALMSHETYELLVVDQGWSVRRWARWIGAHLERELLG